MNERPKKNFTLVVDGNDGTGKTTLVESLRQCGFKVKDRGIITKMTDDQTLQPNNDEWYVILDVPVEVSRARLIMAKKDLTDKYHTIADLTYYRERFIDIAKNRLTRARWLIDASGSKNDVLDLVIRSITLLERFGSFHLVRENE